MTALERDINSCIVLLELLKKDDIQDEYFNQEKLKRVRLTIHELLIQYEKNRDLNKVLENMK